MTEEQKSKATAVQIARAIAQDLNDIRIRKELWDILTALRGPDNNDPLVKAATTEVIRRALGMSISSNLALVSSDLPYKVEHRKRMVAGTARVTDHFLTHAKSAFAALGLKWDELNKE